MMWWKKLSMVLVSVSLVVGIGLFSVAALRPPSAWPVYTIELDCPANTTTTLVVAQSKRIRVVGMWGVAGAAGTVTFKSDTTEISGDVPVALYNGAVLTLLPPNIVREYGWMMDTAPGEALKITTSADVTFDGTLSYAVEQ